MIWLALIVIDGVLVVCGTYLIVHGHPWFALLLFLMAAFTSVRSTPK